MRLFSIAHLGRAYALTGRLTEGLELSKEAVDQSAAMGMMYCHTYALCYLADAYLLAGQSGEAMEAAQRSLHLSRKYGMRGYENFALYHLGEVSSHPQDLNAEKAEAYYRQAITLAEELGMRAYIARSHLGLGRLYARTKDRAKATEHLTVAGDMCREMGMNFWLRKTEEVRTGHLDD